MHHHGRVLSRGFLYCWSFFYPLLQKQGDPKKVLNGFVCMIHFVKKRREKVGEKKQQALVQFQDHYRAASKYQAQYTHEPKFINLY